ncbi:hypothetical protein ACFX12_044628 [Malus domestica]
MSRSPSEVSVRSLAFRFHKHWGDWTCWAVEVGTVVFAALADGIAIHYSRLTENERERVASPGSSRMCPPPKMRGRARGRRREGGSHGPQNNLK